MNSQNTIVSLPDEILDIVQNPIFRETFFRIFKKIKRKSTPPLQEAAYKAFLKVLEGKDIEPGEFFTLYNLFSGDTDVISHVFESLEKTNRTQEVIPSNFEASVRADLHLFSGFHRNFFETHVRLILEGKITESSLTPLGRIGSYIFSKVTELESLSDTQYVMQDASGNIIYGFEIYSQTYGQNWEAFEKDIQTGKGDWKILFYEENTDLGSTHILSMESGKIDLTVDGSHVGIFSSGGVRYGICGATIGDEVLMTVFDITNTEPLYELKYHPRNELSVRDIYNNGQDILFTYDALEEKHPYTHIYSITQKKEIYKYSTRHRKVSQFVYSHGKTFLIVENSETGCCELFDIQTGSFIFGQETDETEFYADTFYGLRLVDNEGNFIEFDSATTYKIQSIKEKVSVSGYPEFYVTKDDVIYTLMLVDRYEEFQDYIITHPLFLDILSNNTPFSPEILPDGISSEHSKSLILKLFGETQDLSKDDFLDLKNIFSHAPFIEYISKNFKELFFDTTHIFGQKVATFFTAVHALEKMKDSLQAFIFTKHRKQTIKNGRFFEEFQPIGETSGYKIFSSTTFEDCFLAYGPDGNIVAQIESYTHGNIKAFFVIDSQKTLIFHSNNETALELVHTVDGTLINIFTNKGGCCIVSQDEDNQINIYDAINNQEVISGLSPYDIYGVETLQSGYIVHFENYEEGIESFIHIGVGEDNRENTNSHEYSYLERYITSDNDIVYIGKDSNDQYIVISKASGKILYQDVDFIGFARNKEGNIEVKGSFLDTKIQSFSIEIRLLGVAIDQPSR